MNDFDRQIAATRAAIAPLDASIAEMRTRLTSAQDRLAHRRTWKPDSPDIAALQTDLDLVREVLNTLGKSKTLLHLRVKRYQAERKAWMHGPLRAERQAEFDRIRTLPVMERRAAFDASPVAFTWEQTRVLREAMAEDGKHPLEPAHRKPKTVYMVDLLRQFENSGDFTVAALTRAIIHTPATDLSMSEFMRFDAEVAPSPPALGEDAEATLRNLRGY